MVQPCKLQIVAFAESLHFTFSNGIGFDYTYNNMQAEYFLLQFDGEEQCVPIVITLYVATTEHAAHIHSAQHCCSYSVANLGLT